MDLDERSLTRFGRWPWPRGQLAQLLEKIEALGAASVGIDMIFAEPDETLRSLTEQPSSTLEGAEGGSSALTPNDAALAAVLGGAFFPRVPFAVRRGAGGRKELRPPSNSCSSLQKPGGKAELAGFSKRRRRFAAFRVLERRHPAQAS